ncbi:MAG: hypothetical protein ACRCX2_16540 [Paraclostridium sp.]
MKVNQIDTIGLYNKVISEIKADVDTLPFTPSYTCYLIGNDPASERYVGLKHKTSDEAGVECIIKRMTPDEFAEEMIRTDRAGKKVRAMLQLPAPEGCVRHFNQLVKWKTIIDVDHLGDDVHLDMWQGNFDRVPGTPRGVVAVLCEELGSLSGKNIAVIGSRSKTTGRFLVPMLQHLNATVGMFHSRSVINENELKYYDAVVSCVGIPNMIGHTELGFWKSKVLVDVGVSFVDGRVVGDFNSEVRSHHRYTPYVNGMGLLTRAFLVRNVVDSFLIQR